MRRRHTWGRKGVRVVVDWGGVAMGNTHWAWKCLQLAGQTSEVVKLEDGQLRGSSTMVLGQGEKNTHTHWLTHTLAHTQSHTWSGRKKSTLDIKQRQHFRFAWQMPWHKGAQDGQERRRMMAGGGRGGWGEVCVGGGRQLAGDSGWRASRIKQLTTALAIGGFSGWPSSDPASLLRLPLPPRLCYLRHR